METYRIIFFVVCVAIIGYKYYCHNKPIKIKKVKKANDETAITIISNEDKKQKDDLEYTLESVNSWINSCDQKAGILLAIVGITITVMGTSDFLKYLRKYIFNPFVENITETSNLSFSWSRFTVFVLLAISMAILITSCYYLFLAINGNIDDEKIREDHPGLEKTSYIFYGSINKMKYEIFKEDNIKFVDDLKSQIYLNSKIATKKFQNYNKGLYWFKFLLVVSIMLFIAIMFIK